VPIDTPVNTCGDDKEGTCKGQRLPSVKDTAKRRVEMFVFLLKFHSAVEGHNIEAAGKIFIKHWYDKTRRLLI